MPEVSDRPKRRTEASVLAEHRGTFTLDELYRAVHDAGPDVSARDDGNTVVHGSSDTRWRRRVRGALQSMKRQGRAHRTTHGVWVIDGTPEAPTRAVLIRLDGRLDALELRLSDAADLLAGMDEPCDLILTDPPYGLGVGQGSHLDTGHRIYGRDQSKVVDGYRDVDPAHYRDFTARWVTAAAQALRPGGYLSVVTGPQQSAWVQTAAEDAGLTYCNSISVGRIFALRTTRRFAHSHWRVTVLCSGPLRSPDRVFTPPADLPPARSGRPYPLDLWPLGSVGRADAPRGALRYPNSLPLRLVDRLIGAFTRPASTTSTPDLVCDPFVGSGTTAVAAWQRGLRFVGADLNPAALAFTAARLSVTVDPGLSPAGPVRVSHQ